MNEPDIERFESELAEALGAMKDLFREFEARLGEVVSAQRLSSSEARHEAANARAALEELVRHAKATADAQRQALTELRQGWQLHVEGNAKAAGAEMAHSFGRQITAGLEQRLADLAHKAESATRRLSWRSTLVWVAGIAIAIPLTVSVGIQAYKPSVPEQSIRGLNAQQTHDAISRIVPCFSKRNALLDEHVCVATDDPPRLVRGPNNEALVVARGM